MQFLDILGWKVVKNDLKFKPVKIIKFFVLTYAVHVDKVDGVVILMHIELQILHHIASLLVRGGAGVALKQAHHHLVVCLYVHLHGLEVSLQLIQSSKVFSRLGGGDFAAGEVGLDVLQSLLEHLGV